jgi:peptidyl-prolyl cis-trans isomerase C
MEVRRGLLAVTACAALAACAAGLSGCGKARTQQEPAGPYPKAAGDVTPVIAKVGDIEITQGYFDKRYEELPQGMKERLSGENWENRFLDFLVDETVVYKAALDAKVNRDPDIRHQLDVSTRTILGQGYYAQEFQRKVQPSGDEIKDYYANHRDEFRQLGRALGSHIQCKDRAKIDEAYTALQRGEHFDAVARRYTEDSSKDNGGLLGWFNRDGYVMGIGFNKQFTNAAFALEPGTYTRPIQIGEDWHIISIANKTEDEVEPLDKVRDKVMATLRPTLARQRYLQQVEELHRTYAVRRFGKYNDADARTADQLYRIAAESHNPYAKLGYYHTLVKQYPKDPLAPNALFMMGFLYSEEIVDEPAARNAFETLIKDYPKSEFVEQSQWMLQNLGRREPTLLGNSPPSDPGALKQRINAARDKQ